MTSPNSDQRTSWLLANTHIQVHFYDTFSAHFSPFCGYICLGEKWARTFPWASTCRQELDLLPRMPHRGTLSPALSRQNRWNTEGRGEEWKRARRRGEVAAILDYSAPRRKGRKMQRKSKRGELEGPQPVLDTCRRCHSICFQTLMLTHPLNPKLYM